MEEVFVIFRDEVIIGCVGVFDGHYTAYVQIDKLYKVDTFDTYEEANDAVLDAYDTIKEIK